MRMKPSRQVPAPLAKCPTGIRGLDEITAGGLPSGRPTLVCGNAGCGKTLMAMEFLVRGATEFGEPGVFMAFEETAPELTANVASLGFDLNALVAARKMAIDHVHLERSEIEQTGDFDLEGLFVRLKHAIDAVGARRVVLDTVEALFGGFTDHNILRAELRRLFRWLKSAGVTAVITGERGDGSMTRHGIEEYVSDCVIVLDHRVIDQVSTRRLRIVKYRGSRHGTNEYPFLIDDRGFSVMPVTALGLNYKASRERLSTGIPRLDAMLGGKGYFRGTSVLVSGTSGSGKTSVAAHLARAACRRNERCLYFLFEESPDQMTRNMRSIGVDLQPLQRKGLLRFSAARPTAYGLEVHLATMQKAIVEFDPSVVVVDPISAFATRDNADEVHAMLVRLIDFLKGRGISAVLLNLTASGRALEHTDSQVSSIIDSWLLLRDLELNGERNRVLYVLKSRGMAHSNQVREFVLSDRGVELKDVYLGEDGVLTGSARLAREARDAAETARISEDTARRHAAALRKRARLKARIAVLQQEIAAADVDAALATAQEKKRGRQASTDREAMERSRHSDRVPVTAASGNGQGDHR